MQGNMHTPPKRGPDPEIHSQNKKDPVLCWNQSEVHKTLQRTTHVCYRRNLLHNRLLREEIGNCRTRISLRLNLKSFMIS